MNAELLKHQIEFISDIDTPFVALIAGYRAGKSYSLCYKMLYMMSLNTQADFALLEPTYGMITRVLIPTMTSILEKHNIPYELLKSEGCYKINMGGVIKTCWLLSAENYTRAAGLTLSCFGIDEIDLMKKDLAQASWNMMVSRLTKGEHIQGFCCSTPEGYNFCYEFFEENAGPDRKLIRASTYENPFVDPIYFENMEKTHTAEQLKAYLNGYFINLTTGNVYYAFDRRSNDTNLCTHDWHQSYPISCGVDFNVNNMACVIGMFEGENVYITEEIIGAKNTEALIKTLKERFPNREIHIYPDSSGNADKTSASYSDIALLKNAGFQVFYKSKNPFVKDRVASVNAKLQNANGIRSLFINTQNCKQLTKSLEQQGYDSTGAPDKSGGLDHLLDAIGYLIYYRFPVQGKASAKIY